MASKWDWNMNYPMRTDGIWTDQTYTVWPKPTALPVFTCRLCGVNFTNCPVCSSLWQNVLCMSCLNKVLGWAMKNFLLEKTLDDMGKVGGGK